MVKVKQKTHSILRELFDTDINGDVNVISSRAEHVFASIENFINMINDTDLDQEVKDVLFKQFVLAVKHKDSKKFMKVLARL